VYDVDSPATLQSLLPKLQFYFKEDDSSGFPNYDRAPVTLLLRPNAAKYDLSSVMMSRLTAVIGLGASNTDVVIIPPLPQEPNCWDGCGSGANSGDNIFFRTLQNLTVAPQKGAFVWNTSQMCPLRRLNILGDLDVGNFCGGFVDLTTIGGEILSTSGGNWKTPQQQYCFRRVAAQASNVQRANQYGFVYVDCSIKAKFPAGTQLCDGSSGPVWSPNKSTTGQNIACSTRVPDAASPLLGLFADQRSFTLSIRGDPAEPVIPIKNANDLKKVQWKKNARYLLYPNVYYLDEPVSIDASGVALVGLGFPVLRMQNSTLGASSIVITGEGCTLASLIVDAPDARVQQKVLIDIQAENVEIYDVTCTTNKRDSDSQVRSDVMLYIRSKQCYLENVWLWRADHWNWGGFKDTSQDAKNLCAYGLVVDVTAPRTTCLALFVEHQTAAPIVWDGDDGAIYMSQGECAYSSMGSLGPAKQLPGHRLGVYLSLGPVTAFLWVGGGVYAIFNYPSPIKKIALEILATELDKITVRNLSIDGWADGIWNAAVVYENKCYGPFAEGGTTNAGLIICDLKAFLQYTQDPFKSYSCAPSFSTYGEGAQSSPERAWLI
jgi:hypothetical protein